MLSLRTEPVAEPAFDDRVQGQSMSLESLPESSQRHATQKRANRFPVVGIGASAGGLEAFTAFFDAMPAKSGLAFVLIQHLPPQRESLLAEILAKHTEMSVKQVDDGMAVEKDAVYVIRPGHTMTISDGHLHLGEPVEKRGHRKPVDDFFRSLAAEQGDRSIIVILSGMGSNGTAGAQAIKASGGICIAQDPDTAQFPSMPRSLIDAGYADHTLHPADIPDLLLKYVHHPYMEHADDSGDALRQDRKSFNEILALLRTRSSYEFGGYKKPTLHRRIQRRMGVNQITQLADYVQFIRKNPEEVVSLANDLLINVTGFFRDPEAWEELRARVIAPLVDERSDHGSIRAWVTACASGEEPYTLAMLIAEEAHRARKTFDVKIFATDAAEKSLAHARAGLYPGGIEGDVSLERLDKFFDKEDQVYRVKKQIREMVVFAPQNLLSDPPFSRLDIACCRNLLIYLEPDVQRKVVSLLHFSLRQGGCLFLGNSETIGGADEMFEPLNKKWRIYRRVGTDRRGVVDLPRHVPPRDGETRPADESAHHPSLSQLAQRELMHRYTPPSVVVDRAMKVVYFHGETGPFLLQPSGEPTRDLIELCRDGVRAAVRIACREAITANRSVTIKDGRIDTDKGPQRILVTAAPLVRGWAKEHLVVSFEEMPVAAADLSPADAATVGAGDQTASGGGSSSTNTEVQKQLEEELRNIREELQSTVEEMESSNEELKASNEEVTSINEELQSTNEELETGKEELQSLNEELTTVNSQLQGKIEELEATTNDLTNLLGSTDIAVIFLDSKFRIRRFTPAVKELLELIPSDTGRPLSDLAQKFTDVDLLADAHAVLEKLVPVEREIRSDRGSWYQRRALPYRTADNRIDGVVITFVDITDRKHSEQAVMDSHARSQAVLDQMPAAVLIVDAVTGKISLANQRVVKLFGSSFPVPAPLVSTDWKAVFSAFTGYFGDGRPYRLAEWPLARSLAGKELVVDEEIEFQRPDGTRWTLSASSAPVRDVDGNAIAVVATFSDMTERKRSENELRESEERFRLLVEGAADYAIFMLDADGKIATWNRGGERLLGYTEAEVVGRPSAILFTPEDRATGAAETEMTTAASQGSASEERWHLRKDGSRFWASGVMHPLRGNKIRSGFVKILRDNTDRKVAEENLQTAKLTAEAANLAKDDFVATVSHELRTPLSAILLWTKMLRADPQLNTQARAGLDTILESAGAQQQLIDDLLDVARMASGKLRITPRPTRLVQSIESALRAILPAADAHGVTITSKLNQDVGVVRADPDRLQQVVWNLLINAVKFTPSGGTISVELLRDRNFVEIVVIDSGIGIRGDLRPHIFDRFRQGEAGTTRLHGGLGLGLTIARQLVELHAGTVEVHSEGENRGSTFTVRLPLPALTVEPSDNGMQLSPTAAPSEGKLRDTRVLLVEDDPATRDAVQVLLTRLGANVAAVESTASAVREFELHPPDLLISDIAMPGADGYALIRQVRAFEKQRGLAPAPAMAVTAFARGDDRQRALDAGFDEHLPKPVDADMLLDVVVKLLKKDK